ncbi:MAG: S41 family peptidase [Rickettsiales bacterium]|nr:S41 family peptidase [Rickettsiales bacterium]
MKKLAKTSLIIVISTAIGFFSAMSFSQIEIKPIKFNQKTSEADQKEFLQEIISRVKKDYVEEKTDRQLAEYAANGLLSSLDPHSSYLNEDALKEMQVQTKGEFGGVGIEITLEFSVVKVVSAIEDTPAFKADIKSGDYIIKVDGKNIAGLAIDEVVKKLRGKPGTKVAVTILRKGEKAPLNKTITREIIKVKAVKSAKFKDVAYVKINSFSEQAYSGLIAELNKLKLQIGEKNLKGFVLDLRNNPGGLLDQAISISDAFLDKDQTIVSISGRNKDQTKYFKDSLDQNLITGLPIVVLINEGSASASEIVAGALQDNNRAIIMGVKSFGKGSVQTVIPLEKNHGALRLTTSLYYTPSGKSIQAHGIEPDIEVFAAKIQKSDQEDANSEADLKGHIEVQIKDAIAEAKKEKIGDDNFALYEKDYQLARAVDLVRGVSIYKFSNKKSLQKPANN